MRRSIELSENECKENIHKFYSYFETGYKFEDFLKAFQSKEFPIFEIHLHNNDGVADEHGFLEKGTMDIRVIADVLKQIDYKGIVTIETVPRMHGYHYPESDARILETYEFWKNCLK